MVSSRQIAELMDGRPPVQKAQCQLFTDKEGCSMPMAHRRRSRLSKFLGAFCAGVCCAAKKCPSTNLNEEQDVRSSTQMCDLPDDILWHILSFLQPKDVVRTSVLSKKWEHLSSNNPRLHISQLNFRDQVHFVNFVDKALLLHDFPVKVFSLFCKRRSVSDTSLIDAWITAVVKRKVEVLHLCINEGLLEYVLPSCVFNSETLIEFCLSMPYELRLPSLVCLNNLKVLTLACVDFGSDSSVEKHLSCCSLEELFLNRCKWRRLKVIQISAPKLLNVRIFEHPLYEGLESTLHLVVRGARIKSFIYRGRFIDYYTISSSSSLVAAQIDLPLFGWPHPRHRHRCAYHEHKLLKDLSCVKRLSLFNPVELIYKRPDLLTSLTLFRHLNELVLETSRPVLLLEFGFIGAILHKSPCLSYLEFTWGICVRSGTVDSNFGPVPQCLQSSLKVIKICNFVADDRALKAIRILLKMAGVLEKLFIHPLRTKQLPGNLLQLLNELPRTSDQCEFLLGV
ncbi:F-box/FBD/LRR-repeat protein At5g56420-like [Rhodamnia argentea]|uniref:F-box/FBD/LRR-repeat protein At5g56420-like n=1 Tax=Rhodamnia argentea TaxID=178133 RepID=A0ABM3HBK0_9MYRT|nr:F-box/FBD/LRR-repeat protein At5g56420-like [Rhodamnia argentea]